MRPQDRDRKGRKMEKDRRKIERDRKNSLKLLAVFTMLFMSFVLSSAVVEAGPMDSIKSAWGSVRVYLFSGAFWINAVIIFGVAFLIYSLLLQKHMGGGNANQTVIYIVLIIIAIVVSTKIVDGNGVPQVMWHNQKFRGMAEYFIGPGGPTEPCAAQGHSFFRTFLGITPNPPCCGTGAYYKTIHGDRVCRQAILRINENGSGLPAFIISAILFFLLFSAFGKNLGFDRTGKWMPIILSLILAAMLANSRVTKNQVVMIGGWVAVLLIGRKLSKSLTGDNDPSGSKKAMGFALAYAFVNLITSMLGTTLFGRSVEAGDIGLGSIVWGLIIGLVIGYIYSMLTGGGNLMGKVNAKRRKKTQDDIDKLLDKGRWGQAVKRAIPLIGNRWRPKNEEEDFRKNISNIVDELERVRRLYRHAADPATRREIDQKIQRLEDRLAETLRNSP